MVFVPVDMDDERFDALVEQALDDIPDEPPDDEPDDLLGLYDGVALTERDSSVLPQLPDRIFIFRGPLLEMCADEDELVEEIRITVVHEIAHHFGIDDRRLHDLGYA